MQFQIRECIDTLESTFRHVLDLYNFTNNGLERTSTSMSSVSTSTMLTARIRLAGWLGRTEGTWRLSSRSRSTTMRLQRGSAFISQSDFQLGDSLDHLSRMTSGILSKILRHLCSDGPLALRHLFFTSKGLYYAAVNDASLWTTISFDIAFFNHFQRRPVEQANNFTEQCLRWSSSLPLCIRISFDNAMDLHRDLLVGPLRAWSNPKYRGFERCTSLIWYHDRWSNVTVKEMMTLLPTELPSLRHLSLTHLRDPTDGTHFPNCPVLEKVEILAHFEPYPFLLGTNLAQVTTLSFGKYSDWLSYDIYTLSIFPALRDLTLFTTYSCEFRTYTHPGPAPPFQRLQTLRVRGNLPPTLFTGLVAPALETLHIEANDLGMTPTHSLRDSFSSLCLRLYAPLPQIVGHRDPRWATDLSTYVRKCTRIETLVVSKWMEEECRKFLGRSNVLLHIL